MTYINTTLTTSGNSVAVRLPKELLKMSGLGKSIKLEAKKGKIIISKSENPREGWAEQIAQVISSNPQAVQADPELADWDNVIADGLDDDY